MDVNGTIGRLTGRTVTDRVVVRQYGRDSLVVWANVLLAPLFAAMGLRVGLQSDERIVARIESDRAAMRRQGYLLTSLEAFALPVLGRSGAAANWYRATFERVPGAAGGADDDEHGR